MNITLNKKWIALRELPDSDISISTYIPLQNIEHISFVEDEEDEYHIFVSTKENKYLFTTVETMREAEQTAVNIANDIEESK